MAQTQAAYAMECVISEAAEKAGVDPVEFRRINHIREGESSPIFEKLGEGKEGVPQTIGSCGLEGCIDWGVKEIEWGKEKSSFCPSQEKRKRHGHFDAGIQYSRNRIWEQPLSK